ncbi:DUF3088 family protein [Algimonas porphyrae]|uniref:DUF3088 family protein n=1 Tax=Algimonas porphyrae TaxID=1128113 RepID=A0ABQ5UZL9_9PROT|nr:DUF3088 family protein [Algimonas porphyrae]GLQ19417.1 hypothetical protein GCM10007854_03720 [Algimonas porphyrae]
MSRDQLFLLPPGFADRGERQYCPECAELWGLLAYYPAIKATLDVNYEGVAHPRKQLVARLGEGNWNCPTLVLAAESPEGPGVKRVDEARYIDNARDMGRYWAALYGTAVPR